MITVKPRRELWSWIQWALNYANLVRVFHSGLRNSCQNVLTIRGMVWHNEFGATTKLFIVRPRYLKKFRYSVLWMQRGLGMRFSWLSSDGQSSFRCLMVPKLSAPWRLIGHGPDMQESHTLLERPLRRTPCGKSSELWTSMTRHLNHFLSFWGSVCCRHRDAHAGCSALAGDFHIPLHFVGEDSHSGQYPCPNSTFYKGGIFFFILICET